MVSFIIFDDVCSVGSQRGVYMRENKPRTARVNGTKSMFTAYSTQGQLKPRLILAEGFWYGLIQAAAHLGRESVRINALKRCPRQPGTTAAHALFSIISQTVTAERRALEWRENEFCLHLQIKVENGG